MLQILSLIVLLYQAKNMSFFFKLPFDTIEDKHVVHFLTKTDTKFLFIYLVQRNRYSEAVKISRNAMEIPIIENIMKVLPKCQMRAEEYLAPDLLDFQSQKQGKRKIPPRLSHRREQFPFPNTSQLDPKALREKKQPSDLNTFLESDSVSHIYDQPPKLGSTPLMRRGERRKEQATSSKPEIFKSLRNFTMETPVPHTPQRTNFQKAEESNENHFEFRLRSAQKKKHNRRLNFDEED